MFPIDNNLVKIIHIRQTISYKSFVSNCRCLKQRKCSTFVTSIVEVRFKIYEKCNHIQALWKPCDRRGLENKQKHCSGNLGLWLTSTEASLHGARRGCGQNCRPSPAGAATVLKQLVWPHEQPTLGPTLKVLYALHSTTVLACR